MFSTNDAGSNTIADVIIVGAGFSGCYALHRIRSLGYATKILEAESNFGGVWHINKYPGARVDSEVPSYQLSLPEVWSDFNFHERYPGSGELREYFAHMDKALDLRKDTIFNARVEEVRYDQASKKWTFQTSRGLIATSTYAVFASGTTCKPYIPEFLGLSDFKGKIIHPAAWPEDFDSRGKKIGLIGQGASGLQILQELAKQDCKLSVFIRTPCIAIPMRQRAVSEEEVEGMKNMYDGLFAKAKYASHTGYPYNSNSQSYYDATEDERKALYERLWARGGFGLLVSNFYDTQLDKTANASLYNFWAKKVRARMTDVAKMEIVAPLKQAQWFATKRPNLEMDYYEMLDRPNVRIVDLKTIPITKFIVNGIITRNQESEEAHDFDAIIVATGYDSVTGSLFDMNIYDKNGSPLHQNWKKGLLTYLGMMVPNLPNAFLLYGPQAPTSLANGPPFIEMQVDWIAQVLEKAHKEKVEAVEPSEAASKAWREKVIDTFESTLYKETASWWSGANIPGKNREPLIYFGGLQSWWQSCLKGLENWSNFVI